jgi:hypothetical protein
MLRTRPARFGGMGQQTTFDLIVDFGLPPLKNPRRNLQHQPYQTPKPCD